MTRHCTTYLIAASLVVLAIGAFLFSAAPVEAYSKCKSENRCAITGIVYSGSGEPAKGATVTATDEYGKEITARANSQGRFRLNGIEPGALYHFEVKHPEGMYQAMLRSFLEGDQIEIRPVAEKRN